MTSLPFISVIVPTFNRASRLPALVASLERQEYPEDLYEIIIVDDGSADGTLACLSRMNSSRIRVLSQDHGGASRARNLGAANAFGEILAFTDDDCLPEQGWLHAIGESWVRHGPNAAVLGHTYSEHPANTFIHSVFKDSLPVVTCNFAVARRAFEGVGGFDPHFILYFEDEDLGLRLQKAGTAIVYEPAMRVLHPSKYQSFRGFLRLRSGLQYFCYMSQKHPDCDHWIRHRAVTRQIWRKTVIVGLPLAAGAAWTPAFLSLFVVLALYIVRDGIVAARYRKELDDRGFHLRAVDMVSFVILNWAVPFLDGARILKGYLQSYGEFSSWTAAQVPPPPPASHVRIVRALRMLCSNPVRLGQRIFRRLRLHLPHSPRQILRLGQVGRVRLELDVRDLNMKAMYQDLYEVDDISFLRKILRPGGTVFDVGANIGYLTAVAASLVGRTGYVHAFEPVPELYRRLERLKALNPQFNIRLSKQAAGAKSDWLDLSLSRDGNLGWNTLVPGFMAEEQSSGQLRVEVIALDQYLAEQGIERLDFVKIDVEGFEFPVLHGLRYALKHLRPVVLCEIAPGAYPAVGHTIEELEAFLEQFEYRTFDVRMNPVRIRRLSRTSNVVLLPRHHLHF